MVQNLPFGIKITSTAPAPTTTTSTSITGDKSTYNTSINTSINTSTNIQPSTTWTEKIKPKAKTLIEKVKSKLEDRVSPAPEQK